MPQKSSYQVLIFHDSDTCHVVRADNDWTIVWLTRDSANSLANHILDHLNEFPDTMSELGVDG